MNTIKNLLSDAWDSTTVRLTLLLVAVGSVPCFFLCMAKATLVG